MANSSLISDNTPMAAAEYNALRDDVNSETTGHDHSGVTDHGKPIAWDEWLAYLYMDEAAGTA